jgi:hypothetical protein
MGEEKEKYVWVDIIVSRLKSNEITDPPKFDI